MLIVIQPETVNRTGRKIKRSLSRLRTQVNTRRSHSRVSSLSSTSTMQNHTWHVIMYGYSTSFFSPSGPKGDFRRRNLFSLEIRGVYGVFPRRAGPQARGPGEPFGQDRLKSGSAFFNIIPQTSPKQNCSPERASMWPACVLHLLVLCPLVAHAP